jgi:hypothetical protein
MNITLVDIPSRDNNPIKHKKYHYPQSTAPDLPRNFFVFLGVGARASGKTFSCVKLLDLYSKYPILNKNGEKISQRIILFSPTIDANPIFNSLKYLDETDIHTEYNDDKLLKVLEDIKLEKEETEKYQYWVNAYEKFKRVKHIKDLSSDMLLFLHTKEFEPPSESDIPNFPNGVINHIVFDDLVGSSCFKSVGKSALTNLVLKNRHLSSNILILSQNLKAIPKSVRANTSVFALFRFNNKKIIEDLYEEVSNMMKYEEFESIYNQATEEPHNFLLLDFTQVIENRIKMNFNKLFKLDK